MSKERALAQLYQYLGELNEKLAEAYDYDIAVRLDAVIVAINALEKEIRRDGEI